MRTAAAALALVLGACGLPPMASERVALSSRDYGFVDQVYLPDAGTDREVSGFLSVPEGPGPFPAIVILHGAQGQGAQDFHYAALLRAHGFASLAIDSFTGRGVRRTVEDPTLVSESAMIADAFAGLRALKTDERIDGERIAVLGFSKGGIAALYSAFDALAARIAPDGARFAAHAAFYPWCGLQPYRTATTGRPVLIVGGDADRVAPVAACAALVETVTAADAAADIELVVYPGASHAFDHPSLAALPFFDTLPVAGLIPTRCHVVETAPGAFTETSSGRAVTSDTVLAVLEGCSDRESSVTADPAATADAQRVLLDFLAATLH